MPTLTTPPPYQVPSLLNNAYPRHSSSDAFRYFPDKDFLTSHRPVCFTGGGLKSLDEVRSDLPSWAGGVPWAERIMITIERHGSRAIKCLGLRTRDTLISLHPLFALIPLTPEGHNQAAMTSMLTSLPPSLPQARSRPWVYYSRIRQTRNMSAPQIRTGPQSGKVSVRSPQIYPPPSDDTDP